MGSYDFNIENNSFKNGIAKIAFNFAIEKGVDFEILRKGVEINKKNEDIEKISFKFPLIPFIALNPIDTYLELETNMEFYHNLILFSQENMLWCYVDLFNTFQYYVLLSEEWDNNIYISENYLQLLQKSDRKNPQFYIRRPGSLTVGYQKKVPAGRIKPAFFVSNFWFLSIVFYCNVL